MPTGGKIKFKLGKNCNYLTKMMKPVGRQAPIKLSFLCKIPWMQKFQLDTGHFLWTWQCIFICNSAVTPSSGAWLCLVPGCAPCRPVAVKSSRWRRPVMRSGARVTLNIGHAHFTQAPDPSPTLIFSRSLAKRSFFHWFCYIYVPISAGFSVSCQCSSSGYKGMFSTNWKLIFVNRW